MKNEPVTTITVNLKGYNSLQFTIEIKEISRFIEQLLTSEQVISISLTVEP